MNLKSYQQKLKDSIKDNYMETKNALEAGNKNSMSNMLERIEKTIKEAGDVFNSKNSFISLAHKWIGSDQILSWKVNKKEENVILICIDEDTEDDDVVYTIYRFFILRDNWQVSRDIQSTSPKDIFDNLLEN